MGLWYEVIICHGPTCVTGSAQLMLSQLPQAASLQTYLQQSDIQWSDYQITSILLTSSLITCSLITSSQLGKHLQKPNNQGCQSSFALQVQWSPPQQQQYCARGLAGIHPLPQEHRHTPVKSSAFKEIPFSVHLYTTQ